MEELDFEKGLEMHAEWGEAELVAHFKLGIEKMLATEPHKLFSYLYRIDVSEAKVKLGMDSDNPAEMLALLIVKKLKDKLYWRNKYKVKKDNEIDSGDHS